MKHNDYVWQLDNIRDYLNMPNDLSMNRERAMGMRIAAESWIMHLFRTATNAQQLWTRENHPELWNKYHPRS